jgi:hypothetical protein
MIVFRLHSWVLAFIVFGVVFGATVLGWWAGRRLRDRPGSSREPFAVMQGATLGFMGLILAFGLSLAVGRHESRRAAVITESNAIGTTYLRAQTLAEPVRNESLGLLERYADTSIRISETVPDSAGERRAIADSGQLQRQLWALAGQALDTAPDASAPRLYVETLNEMFDAQFARVAGLSNRVPTTVLALELIGASIALALLSLHLAVLGRGVLTSALGALLVSLTLLVTFDLDRPTRGLIRIPSAPLVHVRATMVPPPAASAPSAPIGS